MPSTVALIGVGASFHGIAGFRLGLPKDREAPSKLPEGDVKDTDIPGATAPRAGPPGYSADGRSTEVSGETSTFTSSPAWKLRPCTAEVIISTRTIPPGMVTS